MATENLDMDYSKYDFKDSTEMDIHLSRILKVIFGIIHIKIFSSHNNAV